MSKQEERRIAALARKNAARVKPPVQERATQYDDTLRHRPEEQDAETRRLFKDMKKREF